jgi:hypothetical protein
VARAGGVALGLRRVLAVVAGQVEGVQVHERVAAMDLVLAEGPAEAALPGRQVGLVVRVREGFAVAEAREGGGDAGLRQVLDDAVVPVVAHGLAHLGDHELADRVHAPVSHDIPPHLPGPAARRAPSQPTRCSARSRSCSRALVASR